MEANPMPEERVFRIGTLMCVIWIAAGTILIGQTQRTDFAASAPHAFVARAN
jgi:hypothetical protein